MASPPEVKGSTIISMTIDKDKWRAVEGGGSNQVEQFSSVHRINGYPWRLRLDGVTDRSGANLRSVYLICDKSSEAELWKCTATISCHFLFPIKHTFNSWDIASQSVFICSSLSLNMFGLYFYINSEDDGSIWRTIPTFDPLLDNHTVILVIGDEKKKIKVNKKSLASQSPFFDRLFFGDFKEQNMNEITIGDVNYEEFWNIMKLLYRFDGASLTDDNLINVLGLADRFEIKIVKDKVVSYLLSFSSSLSIQKKIILADEYNLPFLLENLEPIWAVRSTLKKLTKLQFEQMSKASLRVLFKTLCTTHDSDFVYDNGVRMIAKNKDTFYISITMGNWNRNQTEQFSPVHHVKGYFWRLRLYAKPELAEETGFVPYGFSLICDKSSASELWHCTATINLKYFIHLKFAHKFTSWDKDSQLARLCDIKYRAGDCLKVAITLDKQKQRWRLCPTFDPSEPHDGIIVIGEEKQRIEVNKESLASQSPYVKNLFFGEDDEKNESEVAIRDVDYEEFANIIKLTYRIDGAYLTDENLRRVLEIAQRFEIKIVEDRVVSYLLSKSCNLPISQKLLIVDQNDLPFIDVILNLMYFSMPLNSKLMELSESPEFEQLSFKTLRVLFKKF